MKINMQKWAEEIIAAKDRRNLPVLYFPLAAECGLTVTESVSDPNNIVTVMKKVLDRYPETIAAVTGMDLTVDTEAFGGKVMYAENMVPSICEHPVADVEAIHALKVPDIHSGRVDIFTEATRRAQNVITDRPIMGGMLGPFSLAANLMEVSNALITTMMYPEDMKVLLDKTTEFLIARAKEYKAAGANGIFIAEPTAGLLSPELLDEYSSVYVKKLVEAVQDDYFFLILHDCGNVKDSVKSMYDTGCKGHHYGNNVDMKDILCQIPADILVFGNIDPSTAFFSGTPESVYEKTTNLLNDMKPYPHFVLSSGCDLAAQAPLANVDAYYQAQRDFNAANA